VEGHCRLLQQVANGKIHKPKGKESQISSTMMVKTQKAIFKNSKFV
jgi:hypothetical protein